MNKYLDNLPKDIRDLLLLISDLSRHKGMPVYLVGGVVRDLLLGVGNLDLDIVVEGDGIIFAEELGKVFNSKVIRHRRFNTATVLLKPHFKIDVATARSEFYPHPAHLPVVKSAGLMDDLFRRDFTINAMAISINNDNFGELMDFFHGKKDLDQKKIRVLHDLSFIDDPTRILRAIRFEQRYKFKIEEKTLLLLRNSVNSSMMDKIEPQRMRDELIMMLKEKDVNMDILRMQKLCGFDFISRKIKIAAKTLDLINSLTRQINWFKGKFPQRRNLDNWLIYLMGILDSLSLKEVNAVCRKLVFRKGEEKRIMDSKSFSRKNILLLSKKNTTPSRIYALLEPLSYESLIFLKAKYKSHTLHRHILDFLNKYNGMRIHIKGNDLRDIGIIPGPGYQKIFSKILDARLDGIVTTKEEELDLAKRIINRK